MSKKNVLFVVHHLTIGGVQKSLISALNFVDYRENNVTLYIRRNRLDLLPYINENVNVIINNDKHHYYRFPYVVFWQMVRIFKGIIKKDIATIEKKIAKYVHKKQLEFEQKQYFANKSYDVAIAYNEGYTAEFVMECVTAKRKFMFFQSSTDSKHDVHERIMPQYDVIVAEHPDIKKSLISWYRGIDNKIRIIENYSDYQFIRKLSREYNIIDNSIAFTLCTCSRFSPEKGLDLAVESAKILRDKGFVFIWYLVGDGSEKANLQHLIEKYELEEYVLLPGMQKNPYPYMAACDVYVQPSREEALSIAMLESQMLCAPMVSTKTAGGIAMIKDGFNGLLAEINAESLADKIERLINDDALKKWIKRYLLDIDYSAEEKRYKNDWSQLLKL